MAIDVTEKNFVEETAEGLVLVDFWAPWCGPCRMLGPVLENLQGVKVLKVNVDTEKDLAVAYNVSSIPRLVFLKDGKQVADMVGLQGEKVLQEKINELHGLGNEKMVVYDEDNNPIGAQG